MSRRRRRWPEFLVGALVLAVGSGVVAMVIAFGGTSDDASDGGSQIAPDMGASTEAANAPGAPTATTVPGGQDQAAGGSAGSGSAGAEGTGTLSPEAVAGADRMVTFRADLSMEVDDLTDATNRANAAMATLGGYAAKASIDLSPTGSAALTFRVPAANFAAAKERLAEIGRVTDQNQAADDVTAQYTDLESRVATMRASITRLQGFLVEATDVGQIALLEGELTRREAELESIEAQRRVLADQADMATISVAMDSDETGQPSDPDGGTGGFRGGLERGWDAATLVGSALFTAAGFLLPFLPLLIIAGFVLWWIRRRRNHAAATAGRPT
ncbi:MAG: DUF4349 domain-containing protein [Acidimicrobiales bacterium]